MACTGIISLDFTPIVDTEGLQGAYGRSGVRVILITSRTDLLVRERKLFFFLASTYVQRGMEKSDEPRTRRDEQRRKYSKMDKRAKDKLVRSPRENGGG